MKQESDSVKASKHKGAGCVSLLFQGRAWLSSPLPSASLQFSPKTDNFSHHPASDTPFRCRSAGAEQVWLGPAVPSCSHRYCLLFYFQIQGMTALPPDIERPYKAEPLVCGTSSSVRRSFSPKLLLCLAVLGSSLGSTCLWSYFCGAW